jgi:plasmid maintenance system antidote protein VapI
MVNSTDFAKRLGKILDYYGLSATAFSEKIDFNRSTISHLISGRNKPSLEFVMKVVNTFEEVNLYWLLNGKGTFPSTNEIEKKEATETAKFQNNKTGISVEKPIQKNASSKISNVEETEKIISNQISNVSKSTIERVIIFYKDGSFKEYLP